MSNKLNFTCRLSPFKSVRTAICFPDIRPVADFRTQGNQIAVFFRNISLLATYILHRHGTKKNTCEHLEQHHTPSSSDVTNIFDF